MFMKNAFMALPAAALAPSADISPVMMIPFGALLLLIALGPLLFSTWWHRHYPKVSLGLGILTAGYYLFALRSGERLLDVAHEYVSFIALIGSLFVIAGGIHITVKGDPSHLGMSSPCSLERSWQTSLGQRGLRC
jgi:hypothetical protein